MLRELISRLSVIVLLAFPFAAAAGVPANECDRLAAGEEDRDRVAPGVEAASLIPQAGQALSACRDAVREHPETARFHFQLARALYALQKDAEGHASLVRASQLGSDAATDWLAVPICRKPVMSAEDAAWVKQGAERGNLVCQECLILVYQLGRGTSVNLDEANRWARRAADRGSALGMHALGFNYYFGNGFAKDVSEALKWLRLAAQKGRPEAQGLLAQVLFTGRNGNPIDINEAAKWAREGAIQGDAQAQAFLGLAYRHGHGVPQDNGESVKWLLKSVASTGKGGTSDILCGMLNEHRVPASQLEAVSRVCDIQPATVAAPVPAPPAQVPKAATAAAVAAKPATAKLAGEIPAMKLDVPAEVPQIEFQPGEACNAGQWQQRGALWASAQAGSVPTGAGRAQAIGAMNDIAQLSQADFTAAVSTAKEGMRVLYGPLSPENDKRFEAQWAPLFDNPSPELIAYLERLNPLLARFLAARQAFGLAAGGVNGTLLETAVLAGYGAGPQVEDGFMRLNAQRQRLADLYATMAQLAGEIERLGNPPNPLAQRCDAARHHMRALEALSGGSATPLAENIKRMQQVSVNADLTDARNPGKLISAQAGEIGEQGHGRITWDGLTFSLQIPPQCPNAKVRTTAAHEISGRLASDGRSLPQINATRISFRCEKGVLGGKLGVEDALALRDVPLVDSDFSQKFGVAMFALQDKAVRGHLDYSGRLQLVAPAPREKVVVAFIYGTPADASPAVVARMKTTLQTEGFGDRFLREAMTDVEIGTPVGQIRFGVSNQATKDAKIAELENSLRAKETELVRLNAAGARPGQPTPPGLYGLQSEISVLKRDIADLKARRPELGNTGSAPAVAKPVVPGTPGPAQPEEDGEARNENIAMHRANIDFLQGTLTRLETELARETQDGRQKSLLALMLKAKTDIQAEEDLVASIQTGTLVHTRSAFDDYAHERFVDALHQEAQAADARAEQLRRAEVAIHYRAAAREMVEQLPSDQRPGAREELERTLTWETISAGSADLARATAQKYGTQLQAAWRQEGMKQNEIADRIGRYESAAKATVFVAGSALIGFSGPLLVEAFGAGSAMATYGGYVVGATYGGVTGTIEGGPKKGAKDALAWASTITYGISEFVDGMQKGKTTQEGLATGAWQASGAVLMAGLIKVSSFIGGKLLAGETGALLKNAKGGSEPIKIRDINEYTVMMERGVDRVKQAQSTEARLAQAIKSGANPAEITRLEEEALKNAARINGDFYAKLYAKTDNVPPEVKTALARRIDRIYDRIIDRLDEKNIFVQLKKLGYDPEQIFFKKVRNPTSSGVGMDLDLAATEASQFIKNGQRVSRHQFMEDAQNALHESYAGVTGARPVKHEWLTAITPAHKEGYRSGPQGEFLSPTLPITDPVSGKIRNVVPNFGKISAYDIKQAGEVTWVKSLNFDERTISPFALGKLARMQEVSRGTAKDINTKLMPYLEQKIQQAQAAAARNPAAAKDLQNLRELKAYWSDTNVRLAELGQKPMDGGQLWKQMRELKGFRQATGGATPFDIASQFKTVFETLPKMGYGR